MKHFLYALSVITIPLFFYENSTFAQDSTMLSKATCFPDKLLSSINAKSEATNSKLVRETTRYLQHMAKEEQKLRRKVSISDSTTAQIIFGNAASQYALLLQQINDPLAKSSGLPQNYLPHLDSLQTALKFFDRSNSPHLKNAETELLLKKARGNIDMLQDKFSQVENIKQFMNQRKKLLENQLLSYGLTKDLVRLQKQVYYYQAHVEAYKQQFNNPSVLEARAMEILRKTTLFKNFFKEHSQLAGLFRLPETGQPGRIAGFASLQTRESLEQQMLQRFGSLPDVQQMEVRQIKRAQLELNQLKDKINKLSPGSGDGEMPNFRPNDQKTRSFLKRLEVGTNLQTVKSNYFFPSTSDIALSVGYKINDKSTAGVGGSYKMGWGRDIRHVTISHQGIGLRSFIDVKIKGSFWLSGGAEMNYRSQFSNFELLDNFSPWQKSALLGLSKKYRISKTLKGNMQLMYDFLSREQVPRTQSVLFRIGYVW